MAAMETLLLKHKRREQILKARAEEISALEATAHSLHQSGHPEARSILAKCQGLLLRYPWLWGDGNWGELAWISIIQALPFLFNYLVQLLAFSKAEGRTLGVSSTPDLAICWPILHETIYGIHFLHPSFLH